MAPIKAIKGKKRQTPQGSFSILPMLRTAASCKLVNWLIMLLPRDCYKNTQFESFFGEMFVSLFVCPPPHNDEEKNV